MTARSCLFVTIGSVLLFLLLMFVVGKLALNAGPRTIPAPISGEDFLRSFRDAATETEDGCFSPRGDTFEVLALQAAFDWQHDQPDSDGKLWFGKLIVLPDELVGLDEPLDADRWHARCLNDELDSGTFLRKDRVGACVWSSKGVVRKTADLPLASGETVAVLIALPGRLFCFYPAHRSYWTVPDLARLRPAHASGPR